MSEYKHTFSDGVQEGVHLTVKGSTQQVWRPSVAYPFIGGLWRPYRCACGKRFWNMTEYQAHYIYQAVWENESDYIPNLLAPPNHI